MTNLYDFLRRVYAEAMDLKESYSEFPKNGFIDLHISKEELIWLEQYLVEPGHEIHFKARKVGEDVMGETIYAQDYAIKGEPVDIFCLITEAMMQNAFFAEIVMKANDFYIDHIPTCKHCKDAVEEAQNRIINDYTFKPHK